MILINVMIIYNVTINVEESVHSAWLTYMKENHIPDVLNTGCFTGFTFCRILSTQSDEEGMTYPNHDEHYGYKKPLSSKENKGKGLKGNLRSSGRISMKHAGDYRDEHSTGVRLKTPDNFDTSDTAAVAQMVQSSRKSGTLFSRLDNPDPADSSRSSARPNLGRIGSRSRNRPV